MTKHGYIIDETKDGYTIQTDSLKEGDKLQCRDDPDMHVIKNRDGVTLVKKCFKNNCFSK